MIDEKYGVFSDKDGKIFRAANRPQPCKRFKDEPLGNWIRKLNEESAEVYDAAAAYEAEHLMLGLPLRNPDGDRTNPLWFLLGQELADVVTVCFSMFHAYGFTEKDIADMFFMVNKKNGERGYLWEDNNETAEEK